MNCQRCDRPSIVTALLLALAIGCTLAVAMAAIDYLHGEFDVVEGSR